MDLGKRKNKKLSPPEATNKRLCGLNEAQTSSNSVNVMNNSVLYAPGFANALVGGTHVINVTPMETSDNAINVETNIFTKPLFINQNLALYTRIGNIVNQNADAIVNAVTNKLEFYSNISRSISKTAGQQLELQCREIAAAKSFELGDCIYTLSRSSLLPKYVLHAIVSPITLEPISLRDSTENITNLGVLFYNVFRVANDELHLNNIAVPAIGSGIYGISHEACARAFFYALQIFVKFRNVDQALSLQSVQFVCMNVEDGFICSAIFEQLFTINDNGNQELDGIRCKVESRFHINSGTAQKGLIDSSISNNRPTTSWCSSEISTTRYVSWPCLVAPQFDHNKLVSDNVSNGTSVRNIQETRYDMNRNNKCSENKSAISENSLSANYFSTLQKDGEKSRHHTSFSAISQFVPPTLSSNSLSHVQSLSYPAPCLNFTHTSATSQSVSSCGVDSANADPCAICLDEKVDNPKKLQCGHIFCTTCIDSYFKTVKPVCPVCGTVCGTIQGDQPPGGSMSVKELKNVFVPGYPECSGALEILYNFPPGIQGPKHPHPNRPYPGTLRRAYLPANKEGYKVCQLLQEAFKRGLVFTIGQSRTTGMDGVITWNDIHHKTSLTGGPTAFGYPDSTYLSRVMDELAAKGVV